MPVVPVDENRVALSDGVSARFRAPDLSGTGLEAVGRGLQQVGAAGAEYAQVQDQIQDHADKLGARDLGLQYQKARDDITREFGQLAGQDASSQGAAFQQRLSEAKKGILNRAGNARAKSYLGPMLDELELGGANYIADHSAKQLRVYQDNGFATGITLAQQSAAQYWSDPKLFKQHMDQGLLYVEKRAALNGTNDPNSLAAAKLKFTTEVYSSVLDGMLAQPDPPLDQANAYFEAHRNEMSVAAQGAYLRSVQKPMQKRQDYDDLQRVIGGGIVAKSDAPSTQAALGTMRAITMASESGGNPNAVSVKGAVGTMQTMPGTLRDPGFGVRAAQNNSPAELERVGNDYLAAMMERYGNDPAKAWAAYNWGPGNLDKAMAEHGANWLAHAPAETRNYVARNMAQLNGGHTVETPREWDKDQVYNRIDAAADREGWSFERTERVKRRADEVISRDEELLRRQEKEAGDQALQVIIGLGDRFTDINQIPAAIRAKADFRDLANWKEAADRNRVAQTQIPKDGARSIELQIMARANPDGFLGVDLSREVGKVSPDELKSFALKQAELVGQRNRPQTDNHRSAITTAINWAKKYGGTDISDTDFPRVFDAAEAYLRAKGITAATAKDADEAVRSAMRDVPMAKSAFGIPYSGTRKAYEIDSVSQIPGATLARIDKALTQTLGRAPNDKERIAMYQRLIVQ